MPSKIIDQIHLSPLHMPSPPASFFSQEPHFPSERQIGLWKGEFAGDNCGTKAIPLFSGNKADSSSPLEKHRPVGGNMAGCLELPQTYLFKEQKTKIGLKHSLMGTESTIGVHRTSWRAPNQDYGSRSSLFGQQTFQLGDKVNSNGVHYENGLFSSSLSETFNEKLSLPSNDVSFGRSMDTTNFNFGDDERTLEEIEAQTIGNLLPNDEDLLSGIIDDRDYIVRTSSGGDIEDDLFCSVGGMELEVVDNLNSKKASDFVGGGSSYCKLGDFSGPFAGEHVYREHPSRALSVRNINSNVKDAERRDHFEIREAPHKHHHKFIDFYDVRASEASLHALNNSDIAGKRVQLDPSQHGGAIQSLMPQLSPKQHGISSSVPYGLSSPMRSATVSSQSYQNVPGDLGHSMGQINFSYHCSPAYHPHSLPESHGGITNGIPFSSPSTIQAMDIINSRPVQGVGSGSLNTHSFEHHEGAYGGLGNGSCPLHGHHYVMTSSGSYHHPPGSMMWQNSPAFTNNISHPPPGMHGLPRAPSHALSLHNHHVGSAPTVNPSPWDRWHAYGGDTFETSTFHPAFHPLEIAPSNIFPHAGRNCIDPSMSPAHVGGFPSSQQRCHIFHGKNTMSSSYDAPNDRVRSRRSDANANQAENRKQYELDIDRIMHGEETRTTLMIKNIPNKYTSKMLLATIDEHHRGAYDFIYLPIDFKNKCNVGYAFINMVDPQHIVPFYKAFNGKKWEKFNSEKVASLAYARIQGREALIAHFQNSSLMNEDKRCRPILFHTEGPNAGDQEPFPMGANIRSRSGRPRSAAHEATHQGSPATSANGEESSNAVDSSSSSSSSGSTKETE